MQALDALARSKASLIAAESSLGLVKIFDQTRSDDTQEAFHVRFIPCDTHGYFNGAGTVMVDSFQDLNTSLSVAATVYGVGEDGWESRQAFKILGSWHRLHMRPELRGRRISQEEESQPA